MDATATRSGERLEETPEFELECLYDEPSNPSELTVFAPDRLTTEWLTADRSAAVPLDRIR